MTLAKLKAIPSHRRNQLIGLLFAACTFMLTVAIIQSTFAVAQDQPPAPAAEQMNGSPANSVVPSVEPAPPAPITSPFTPVPAATPAQPEEWAGDTTVSEVVPVEPGTVESLTIVSPAGKERRYLLSVSPQYNPNKAAPILFGFGGWHDTPENYRSYARFGTTEALDEAIVIYPEGLGHAWEGAPYSESAPGEDIAFVRQLIDAVDSDYRVDRTRIYATGMSNGGGMTAVLGCHAQDIFAGVAMVSAAYYHPVEINCGNKPIPVLIVHGTADTLTRYDGGFLHNSPYLPVQAVVDGYARRNRCHAAPPVVTPKEGNAELIAYQGCAANTEHLKVHGADHSWNFAPDVAREVWEFLARLSKEPAVPPVHSAA